jgi:hypothetical protein
VLSSLSNLGESVVRYSLGGLLAFEALSAFAGGYYRLSGAKGVPLEWLEGSRFTGYFAGAFLPRETG